MVDLQSPAPYFRANDDKGRTRTLKDYAGKTVVLYFYPKDWSIGCTKEALEFKRLFREFASRDVAVVGVSRDDVPTHKEFKSKLELPFDLIADPSRKVHEAYGVLKVRMVKRRPTVAVVRSTFVIDRQGGVERIYRNVNPEKHPSALFRELIESGLLSEGTKGRY